MCVLLENYDKSSKLSLFSCKVLYITRILFSSSDMLKERIFGVVATVSCLCFV
jgi:hypothetical protein